MYRFNRQVTELRTKHWLVRIKKHKGHILVSILGRDNRGVFKKSGLTSIRGDLTVFERKHVLFFFLRRGIDRVNEAPASVNYAQAFVSCFD